MEPDEAASRGVRIAHLSDTHLGYEAYSQRTAAGMNQRGADMVRAFHSAVTAAVEWDPPLIIHSGDVFETPAAPVRYQLAAAHELRRCSSLRPDGSRRRTVVIAGNHDTSRNHRDGSQLELFRDIAGVSIVSGGYQVIRFDGPDDPAELADVAVHALPHDTLRDAEVVATVRPIDGCINVLVSHGVAEGPEIFRRMIGREFPIPVDVLAAGWHYVALGHWHTQGPVDVAGDNRYVWYAGSTECVDFSDLRGRTSSIERSWLAVTTGEPRRPQVQPHRFATRRILALDPVDATGKTATDIADALTAQLTAAEVADAVVRQRVTGITRDIWSLVELAAVRDAAADALHHRVEPIYLKADTDTPDSSDSNPDGPDLGDIDAVLVSLCEDLVEEADRPEVLASARKYLGGTLASTNQPDPTDTTAGDTGNEDDETDTTAGETGSTTSDMNNGEAASTTPAGDKTGTTAGETGTTTGEAASTTPAGEDDSPFSEPDITYDTPDAPEDQGAVFAAFLKERPDTLRTNS